MTINYQLSTPELLLSPVFSVYSLRHFSRMFSCSGSAWYVHFVKGVLELPPLFGAVISLVESWYARTQPIQYFAYGSNMSLKRLEDRIGTVKHQGVATLKDYTFLFNKKGKDGSGKANIEPRAQEEVKGVIFELAYSQLSELDPFEGAPAHYERKIVDVCDKQGNLVEVMTYVAREQWKSKKPLKPAQDYRDHILRGAQENRIQIPNL